MSETSNTPNSSAESTIIGRFAPSPTGALHLGSLVAAVASYMIAKQANGLWLVRIEDIDRPREVPGAASQILSMLEQFGLQWDGEVVYQSQRTELYQQAFEELIQKRVVYHCDCSRKSVELRNQGVYDGFCRGLNKSISDDVASRVVFAKGFESFRDQLLAECCFDSAADTQDFVIKRRDGLFAYQLAVVVDDMLQGVNQVVRGADILDSTPRQNFLYHCLNHPTPSYYHVPLVVDAQGRKASKRFQADAICEQQATQHLLDAFSHLGQAIEPSMKQATANELIEHFVKHWNTDAIPTNVACFS